MSDRLVGGLMRWFFGFGRFRIRFVDRLLGNGDARFCGQAGNNFLANSFDAFGIKKDFHRNPLDDLNEIAGGLGSLAPGPG